MDSRVRVLFHEENRGVGGAVMTGYREALSDGADIMVKIDGDGQMDPALLDDFVEPIADGRADYTKGNRFYSLENISRMPKIRIFGNAVLSFMTKLSTGYWNIFDPTNGYTAIHAQVARMLPMDKISNRYFFETDMLFRLGTFRAVVRDVPMDAKYGEEVSNLNIRRVLGEFLLKHSKIFFKRIFYTYYLRDVSLASIELPVGAGMLVGGSIFGAFHWIQAIRDGIPTPVGTVVLSALLIMVGLQLLLGFMGYDIESVPRDIIRSNAQGRALRRKASAQHAEAAELADKERISR
jgi:glycosyltransferase involved in cell wall biosynthesis